MKKLFAILIVAAALAACTREELPQTIEEQPQTVEEPEVSVYTLTIEATKGGDDATRALSLSGKTLSATWAEGERVTVRNVTRSADLGGYLEAQTSGVETTLKGTLSGTIEENDELLLCFLSPSYNSQDGTLAYIAANCDYAEATVSVTDTSTPNVTTTAADFQNRQAIVKFTLRNKAGNASISVTPLKVSDGIHTYTVTPPAATGEFYVALPGFSGSTVSLTGFSGDDTFLYKKSNVTFSNGQYYEITVKMAKADYVDFSLPSGTKWATFNLGASKPEELGDYYAWGATEPWYSSLSPSVVWKPGKEAGYIEGNAPYYYSGNVWTKYNGITDLLPEDDAASVNWGSAWSMPNQEQWAELFSYCTCEAFTLEGVAGYKVSRNDKEIFIPICGHFGGTSLSSAANPFYFAATTGYTGSSTLYAMYAAPNAKTVYHTGRQLGMSVRPVRSGNAIYSYSFGYTGAVQPFIAPVSGTYTLEVWGAQGGSFNYNNGTNTAENYGGLGGYATCRTYLAQGETIYVYVGGQGGHGTPEGPGAGGWNGGGAGGSAFTNYCSSGGGGGATHISKVNNQVIGNGCNFLGDTNYIIVAGGGGGAGHPWTTPGTGGGTEGGRGTRWDGSSQSTYSDYYYYSTNQSCGANGGNSSIASQFDAEGAGGGGAGYYGGTANYPYGSFPNEHYTNASGCGGNSAYNSSLGSNFSTTAGEHWGNGMARIRLYSL